MLHMLSTLKFSDQKKKHFYFGKATFSPCYLSSTYMHNLVQKVTFSDLRSCGAMTCKTLELVEIHTHCMELL